MPIFVNCDCGKRLQGRDEDAGRQTRCPYCNRIITLPGAAAAPEPAAPEPAAPWPSASPSPRPVPAAEFKCRVCRDSFAAAEVYNEDGRYICKRCFDRETEEAEERESAPRRSRVRRRRDDEEDEIIRPRHGGHVNNYLTESILVTIFCCQIFGIIAIVHAAQVNTCLARGDYHAAVVASNAAKTWCGVAFGLGMALIVVGILGMVAMGG